MQIIKYSKFYILLSLLVLVPGIISMVVNGLNLSIDFTGGSAFEYRFTQSPNREKILELFASNNIVVEELVIQDKFVSVRTKPIEVGKSSEVLTSLTTEFDEVEQLSFETIGATIGSETTKKAFLAVGVASLAIVLYIAYAFKNIPSAYSSFRFGISAIVAMLHDALLVLGVFSILGKLYGVEINALFITAILTVIGFSIHDTIVVFDRIRENLSKLPNSKSFAEVVNYSVVETLNRSIATSLTVVITLLALFLLGGESIKYFVLALLIGIISGTYSSIFTASPVLVYWENFVSSRKSMGKK